MNRSKATQRKKQKGFTLVEIMIVIALVVMLGSFAGVKLIDQYKRGQEGGAKVQIAAFQQALQAYYLAHNNYPHTSQGLEALIKKPGVGKIPENYPDGGYFGKKEIPKDPWGNPYRYECEDYQNYTISSDGKDSQEGTEDDIKSE